MKSCPARKTERDQRRRAQRHELPHSGSARALCLARAVCVTVLPFLLHRRHTAGSTMTATAAARALEALDLRGVSTQGASGPPPRGVPDSHIAWEGLGNAA